MAAVLCLDFDDTMVMENTTRLLFERFGAALWRELEGAYQRGEITVEQFNARAMTLVSVSDAEEIGAYVAARAHPREGLMRLVDWAHWHNWQVAIVSNGYNICIDPVLAKLGLDRVMRHAGRCRYGYRWQVRYLSPRGIELEEGFKVSYVAAFRDAGDFVAYAGDGRSDIAAARLAPVAFARSTLLEALDGVHPRVYAFETFDDVTAVLDREADAWLASFSSTTAAMDS